MNKLIRKHQKKLLAFFMVGLMITFAMQSGPRGGNGRSQMLIGNVKGTPLYNSDLEQSHREWQALNHYVRAAMRNPYTGEAQEVPMVRALLPDQVINAINEKPEMFMLLRHEAQKSGVLIDNDELNEILTNNYHRDENGDESTDEVVRDAVSDMLLIMSNFNRLAGDVKISQPLRDQAMAKFLQNIRLNVVEIATSDFAGKLPPPTTQQMQEQFDKFANVDPGMPDPDKNPFGFGYRLQDRVKLQFLTIRHDEAQAAVERSKTPYDWDVQARLYYRQHRDEFPSTQPAPATQSVASTQPGGGSSYQPYEQVSKDALARVREPLVTKLMQEVQGRITSALSSGWAAYSQSTAASQPAGDYPSYTYLHNLADAVQRQFGVRIYVTDRQNGYLSARDLPLLEGIGQSLDNPMSRQANSFAALAMQKAQAYLARSDKGSAALAQLMQPSMPLQDYQQNVYIYRLTDARAAEPAPSLADVSVRVEADLRTQQGFEKAKEAAAPLLTAARAGTLGGAAGAIGKNIVTTEDFNASSQYLGVNITLSNPAKASFKDQAFKLLAQYNPSTNPHPVSLIELPQDAKVFVGQLQAISIDSDNQNFFRQSVEKTAAVRNSLMGGLMVRWFDYDAIVKRLNYQPEKSKSSNS